MNSKAIVEPQNTQIGAYFCEAPSDPCAIVMFGASGDLAPLAPIRGRKERAKRLGVFNLWIQVATGLFCEKARELGKVCA